MPIVDEWYKNVIKQTWNIANVISKMKNLKKKTKKKKKKTCKHSTKSIGLKKFFILYICICICIFVEDNITINNNIKFVLIYLRN